jgi:hypothetical protein
VVDLRTRTPRHFRGSGCPTRRDAAEIARDTGADALEDTGEAIRDSAPDDDAAAQDCTMCTTGGAGRTITADTDPAQHVGGSLVPVAGRATEIALGPVYLTDFTTLNVTSMGNGGRALLVTIPTTMFCDDLHLFTTLGTAQFVAVASWGPARPSRSSRCTARGSSCLLVAACAWSRGERAAEATRPSAGPASCRTTDDRRGGAPPQPTIANLGVGLRRLGTNSIARRGASSAARDAVAPAYLAWLG